MAPQPLGPSGPMARGLLTTTETQDVDLIPFPAQMMNKHEVPFCFDFHVSITTLECPFGSTISGQRPTHQIPTILSEFIAKQVACQPDSYSKQEPNVRTLWPGTGMMVSLMQLIAHFAVPVPISLSASPNHSRIEKLEDDLRLCVKFWSENSMKFSLSEMLKTFSSSLRLTPVTKSSTFWIAVFKFAPPGHEHPFDLTAPDLCVPSISDDVLRQVICRASHLAQNRAAYV